MSELTARTSSEPHDGPVVTPGDPAHEPVAAATDAI